MNVPMANVHRLQDSHPHKKDGDRRYIHLSSSLLAQKNKEAAIFTSETSSTSDGGATALGRLSHYSWIAECEFHLAIWSTLFNAISYRDLSRRRAQFIGVGV